MDFDFTTETITPDTTNVLTIAGTGGIEIPVGTTAERPSSPIQGTIRYNTDLAVFEVYAGSPLSWDPILVSYLTTKGDLLTRNATTDTRLAVGTDGYILTANSATANGLEWAQPMADIIANITEEPTGFPNRTDSTIEFAPSTRTFTISPVGASFSVWQRGQEFIKTVPESIVLPDVSDEYYISYNTSGVLQYSTTFYDLSAVAPVSVISWNSVSQTASLFAEERHGLVMDWETHKYLHVTEGAKYINGLTIGDFTITGSGALDSSAQLSISDGRIADEDITMTISNSATPSAHFQQVLSPIGKFPILYKLGTAWYRNIATNFPVKVGTTYIQWNQDVSGTWQLTEAGTGNYIAMWILATNDVEEPVMSLMGQTVSNSLLAAQTDNQFSSLNIAGIPFAEFRPLYRLIFETNTTYTNTVKAILVDVVNIQISPTIQLTQAVTNGTVTSVTVDGGTTGLTTSGNPITTTGTITLAGTVNTSHGGTGLTALGTASQILGVNTGSTALEYKTVTAGTGISVTPAAGSITIANTGVTSIALSGGTTGLSVTGSPITTSGTITLAGTLNATNGGTGFNTYAVGDILYAGTTTTLSRLADVATGNALISGGVGVAPSWGKVGLATHVSGTLGIANGGTGLTTTPTNGQIDIGNGTGFTRATLTAGTGVSITNGAGTITIAATSTGTVTSVGLALPSIFSVTGSPVTTTGTLTGALATQANNTVFAGPITGGPTAPTFRQLSLIGNDVFDVVLSSPQANQVLAYNSTTSKWNNTGAVGANATGTVGVSPTGGGTAWTLVSGNRYTANFVHNLGTTNLAITVYDTNDTAIVVPQSVTTPDANTITVVVTGNTKTLKVVAVANGQSIVAGGSTPSSVITAYEGVTVSAAATKLNFVGQAVGVTDAGSGTTNITIGSRFTFFAASLDTPVNSDFAVNSLAAMAADPTYPSLNIRSFSNTTEQGVAYLVSIPPGVTTMITKIRGRAQTAPGVASVVQPRIYYRLLPNNSAVGAWSAAQELTNISIPTNANFQYSTQSVLLSTLGMTAGNLYQIELTRRVTGVTGTNLAANFLMAELTVEFA